MTTILSPIRFPAQCHPPQTSGWSVANVFAAAIMAAIAVLGAAGEARAQGIPCRYELAATIAAPPGPINSSPTIALAISPNGRYVVGYFRFDAVGYDHAFAYDVQTGLFHALPHPPGIVISSANDVSDAGLVVGGYGGLIGNFAFVYDLNTQKYVHELAPLVAGGACEITSINASGTVCGHRGIAGPPNYESSAFIWSPNSGEVTYLGLINGRSTRATDLNNDGVTCGTMFVDNVETGFLWDGQTLTPLPTLAGMQTVTFAINASNHVVGYSRVPIGSWPFFTVHATLWDENGITDIGVLLGDSSTAGRINDAGIVLGHQPTGGFVWQDGLVRDLNDLLYPPSKTLHITAGTGITPDGIVVAGALSTNGTVSLVLNPTIFVGDIVPDCQVNIDDLLAVIRDWGATKSPSDINNDGIVDMLDVLIVIENWTF